MNRLLQDSAFDILRFCCSFSQNKVFLTWSVFALVLWLAASSAIACTVPVSRYGLERWPPDPHVFHVRPGAGLQPGLLGTNAHVNAWVESVKSAQTNDMVVTFPDTDLAWYDGPWRPGILDELADSPMRRQIAHELVTGAMTVWVVLEGSDVATNAALYSRVEKQLGELESSLVLPENPTYDLYPGYSNMPNPQLRSQIPLKVKFTLHRLKRGSPGEEFLVRQLETLFTGSGAPEAAGVVAVFGRGRAMPMPPDRPLETAIEEFARFLCDACSCQVKQMNPGLDLLMTANWNDAVDMYPAAAESILLSGGTYRFGGELGGPEPAGPSTAVSAQAATGEVPDGKETTAQRPIAEAPVKTARTDQTLRILVVLAVLVVIALAVIFLGGGRRR